MSKLDKPYREMTKGQRWLFFIIAIILFAILFSSFSIAIQNMKEQYGLNNSDSEPHQKTEA